VSLVQKPQISLMMCIRRAFGQSEIFCVRNWANGFVFFELDEVIFTQPSRFSEVIKHMEFIGVQSLGIISLTSLFTGLALSFQVYLGFKIVNAVNLVGPTVALGITRELGPVLTGLDRRRSSGWSHGGTLGNNARE
jgi:phospholipid/cholesterol/gamma-HCH transport system permease protein